MLAQHLVYAPVKDKTLTFLSSHTPDENVFERLLTSKHHTLPPTGW